MKQYDHKKIEKKWQKQWEKDGIYKAKDGSKKPKFFSLIEFPYPSGDGLHVGHIRSNTAMDIISRKRRAEGYNVLYPVGWDSFGLPTENYAIKTGIHPKIVTKKNTDNFRRQLKALGFSFDWSREVDTSDPNYYKWTQWIFLQMYKKGLAYKDTIEINWCPSCKIGLANEEVIDGCCERCGAPVEKREKEQWMLAITKYADRLDRDLDSVDFLEKIKIQQRNWIGRSEGAEFSFMLQASSSKKDIGKVEVFTTRADTLFGVTYIVVSPEKFLELRTQNSELASVIQNAAEVEKYIENVKSRTEEDRLSADKEKTGIEVKGMSAINPASGEKVPVWVADYVLGHYGTGAVMAVPAHDERDFKFATKYGLPMRQVILPSIVDQKNPPQPGKECTKRMTVLGVVRNPADGKYICLKWKKQPWTTFVTGGAEDDEEIVEAARREIIEETGYTDLKFVRVVGGATEALFYAAHKGVNRQMQGHTVLFELASEKRNAVSAHEEELHEVRWYSPEEVGAAGLQHAEFDIVWKRIVTGDDSYTGDGKLINSGEFDGQDSEKARSAIAKKFGKKTVSYKLRDWVFSRQRYWGEPIPMVYCDTCGWQPVPEKDLPVELPNVKNYTPTDTGESPLATIDKWVKTKCPKCKGNARRETDTMPNWAGSSWYYLRYADPRNQKTLAADKKLAYWTPVDWYNGGMEHTTLHLFYSRFWHKFLYDIGVVPTAEPYAKRTSHGLILAEGGVKMSKSKGNVINPDSVIETYGADSLRVYEMFMGPFDQAISWSTDSIVGSRRFVEKVWRLRDKLETRNLKLEANAKTKLETLAHQTIKKVSEDIESMQFNTAISTLMIYANELDKQETIEKPAYEVLVRLCAPFAPHVTEEIWSMLGNKKSVHTLPWLKYDKTKIVQKTATLAVQVNGKTRAVFEIDRDTEESEVKSQAEALPELKKWIEGKEIKKVVYVPGRILNYVVV